MVGAQSQREASKQLALMCRQKQQRAKYRYKVAGTGRREPAELEEQEEGLW